MLKFELTRFEAQDVITTSGVAAHTHHWKYGESQAVGAANNKFTVNCSEPGCDSVGTFDQPAMFNKTYEWQ